MSNIISLGEILVEIMRPEPGHSLDHPGGFQGPFASGAPAIFAVSAAFIAGIEADWLLMQVGCFACTTGALAVTKLGPMEGTPTQKQVKELYE